jgi:hypothetical protein
LFQEILGPDPCSGPGHVVLQPRRAVEPCGSSCEAAEPHCIRQISVEQVREAVSTPIAGQTSLMEVRAPQANSPR